MADWAHGMAQRLDWLTFTPVVSRPDRGWTGRTGRVPAAVVRMIASMYSNVHATVKVQNAPGCTASLRFPENIGVKQGDPLGPRLFNLFIHDLPSALHRLTASTAPVSLNGQIVWCLLYMRMILHSFPPRGKGCKPD
jgi:hypothetical protein